jgi:hypothetical protein
MGVVLFILAILLTSIAITLTARVEEQRRTNTVTKLAGIETAIVLFVSQMQRLPCPADGTLLSTDINAGLEQRDAATGNCNNLQQTGVVPWRALGLTEADATDGWYHRITYRSAPFLSYDHAMNMQGCDVAGPAAGIPASTPAAGAPGPNYYCAAPCPIVFAATCTGPLSFLEDKGFRIESNGGIPVMNPTSDAVYQPNVATAVGVGVAAPPSGAAFVLISHGPNGAGAYNDGGVLQAAAGVAGPAEAANQNPKQIPVDLNLTTFNDYQYDSRPATYFDDIVVRPSVYTVISKAQLGPKSRNP